MTELILDNGITVLFSYQTPVAVFSLSPSTHEKYGSAFLVTNQWYSRTITRHIHQWLDGAKSVEVEQSVIDSIVEKGENNV